MSNLGAPLNPKVSVIIPTYNRADLLPVAIRSVLSQEFQDFEILVVDDGSNDQTQAVMQTWQDARVRYFLRENGGVSAARNFGISQARGEYLAFLDSDDTFLPAKLSAQVRQLEEDPELGLVTGGFLYMRWDGVVIAERRPWDHFPPIDLSVLLTGCPIIVNAVLVRKKWVDHEGGFDPAMRYAEDLYLWLNLGMDGCKMAWTPEVVCAYRMHPAQAVRGADKHSLGTTNALTQLYRRENLPDLALQLKARAISDAHLSGACRLYGAGEYMEAKYYLQMAVRLHPGLSMGDPPPILSTLVAWAAEPITPDPALFMKGLFEHLPDELAGLEKHRARMMLAACFMASLDALFVGNQTVAVERLLGLWVVDPSVFNHVDLWTNVLIDCVSNFAQDQQPELVDRWFKILPDTFLHMTRFRKKALGRMYMSFGFKSIAQGNKDQAAGYFVKGVAYAPVWLKNRGVLSVLAQHPIRKWLK